MVAMLADLAEDLKLLIRSRHPAVSIVTPDEDRAERLVRRVAGEMGLPLFDWAVTTGLRRVLPTPAGMIAGTESVRAALAHIKDCELYAIHVFKDLAEHLRDATLMRHFRDVCDEFARRHATLVMIDLNPPGESVRRLAVPFDVRWPDPAELEQIIRGTFRDAIQFQNVVAEITQRDMDLMVQALRGLTRGEATRVVSAALFEDGRLDARDLPRMLEAKREILASTGVLESIEIDVAPDGLGGLGRLKEWLARRRGGFTSKAREFGLAPPRGILLLGVQGSGKSLCAKIAAADWGLPLLKLDPGVLYAKYVGDTEARLRQALSQAETMSPVVLWIDEIEKAFASATTASADGGLSQRMFGTMLSWMQDHRFPVFIVATANDVSSLPPELLRKGRFDEVFFVDLPGPDARKAIFEIHLRRRKRDPVGFDLAALAKASDGFSGAEIEQAIISALYAAFADGGDLTTPGIRAELAGTQPLAVLMGERVRALRDWAKSRCAPAD